MNLIAIIISITKFHTGTLCYTHLNINMFSMMILFYLFFNKIYIIIKYNNSDIVYRSYIIILDCQFNCCCCCSCCLFLSILIIPPRGKFREAGFAYRMYINWGVELLSRPLLFKARQNTKSELIMAPLWHRPGNTCASASPPPGCCASCRSAP